MLLIATSLLLGVHLLLVNVAMVGPLIAVWFDWRWGRNRQPFASELGRRLAWCSVLSLVAGSLPGLVLLAMRYGNDGRYWRALEVVPRDRLWFAGAEFAFSLVTLLLYAALWNRWQKWRVVHRLVALAGASNLLMHFPAMFTVLSVISTRPALLAGPIARDAYRRLLIDPEVLSRVVHVWAAAAAVTGVVVVWLALQLKRNVELSGESESTEPAVKFGARLAATATMLQFPIGIWVALAMPESSREPLLGGDAIATLAFLAALGLTMLLINLLSAIVLGDDKRTAARRSSLVMVAVILLMVATRLRLSELATAQARPATDISLRIETTSPLASAAGSGPMLGPLDISRTCSLRSLA